MNPVPASGPSAPGPTATLRPKSSYTPAPRSPTSRAELDIDWTYPVYDRRVAADGERSQSVEAKRALSLEEAYGKVSGEDRRPLLVLRECLTCTGTDDALMTRDADNEKTMLMSRWFHCVKLAPDVLDDDNAFHALFGGDDPSHLFVARWNGEGRLDLNGQQSRTELWEVMGDLLLSEYEKKPDRALKELYQILGKYDRIDERVQALASQIDEVIEKEGPKSSKAKKLKKELTKLNQERSDLREKAVRVSELKLKKEKQI